MDYYNNVINLKVCSKECEKNFYSRVEKIIKITQKHYKLYCVECEKFTKLNDEEVFRIEAEKCIVDRIKDVEEYKHDQKYNYFTYDLCEECLS